MAETPEQTDSMFPILDDAQIARLRSFGEERKVQPGELVFDQGDENHGVFVVLDGSIELISVSANDEAVIRTARRDRSPAK